MVTLYRQVLLETPAALDDHVRNLGWPGTRGDSAFQMLHGLRLVISPSPSHPVEVVSPEVAVAVFLADEEAALQVRQEYLSKAQSDIMALAPMYTATRRLVEPETGFEVILDLSSVRALLFQCVHAAEDRVRIAHPGAGMSRDGIERSLGLDEDMLRRGIVVRSLLHHSTRNKPDTRLYVERVRELGGEVRTAESVPQKMILFDDRVAFIPTSQGRGAIMIRQPETVQHIGLLFELVWADSQPYSLGAEMGRESLAELHATLLRQLSTGRKDEQIARLLGMSVRTCRRHIATVMSELGAASRFQAGVVASRRGLLGRRVTGARPPA